MTAHFTVFWSRRKDLKLFSKTFAFDKTFCNARMAGFAGVSRLIYVRHLRLFAGVCRHRCFRNSDLSRALSTGVKKKVSSNTSNLGRRLTATLLAYFGFELYSNLTQSPAACDTDKDDIIEQADYLYGSGETIKLYQLLIQYKDSENAELLWRLARASRDLAQLSSTTADNKKKLIYEALAYAKKSLDKEPNFAAHKWYAICISDVGDYEGTKAKIANAYVIKEHFQKAIELNPKDATSIHLMGLWCFTFAEMPWYQQKIASMLFATPPTSTYEEALAYFIKAEEVDPNFYSKNLLMLGKTYLKLKSQKMALLWLTKAKDHPAYTEEDKQVQKEAVELLKTLGVKI